MNRAKFSLNSLLLVVLIFSAITFFFVIKLVNLADRRPINDFYPIEDTDVAVRYSSLYPDGLYRGGQTTGVLKLEGSFGYDWGAAAEGDTLYINEYRSTALGVMLCQLDRIDLETYERQILARDTLLRGRCASGELVCVEGVIMPSSFPRTNPLCSLYAMAPGQLRPEGDSAVVVFRDPDTAEVLYAVRDDEAMADGVLEERYLARTLQEVMG